MPPMCSLPTVELPDAPLPSPGFPTVRVPRLLRYYQGAMTSCRPFRRASFPSLGDTTRSARVSPARGRALPWAVCWSWSPGSSGREWVSGDDRISYVPGEPDCALALLFDPGRTDASGLLRCGGAAPVMSTTKAPAKQLSRLNHTASALAAGTMRSMVGFAGRVAPTPRKTRFRLLARLFRTGLVTRRVPLKGFTLYPTLILLSQVQRSARTSLIWPRM
jgi:hypothetical protein